MLVSMRTLAARGALVLAAALAAQARAADAPAADPKYTWNLADLYPSEEACSKPADAAPTRAGCPDTHFHLDRRLPQVGAYASTNYDLDTRVGRAEQMQEQAR